MISPDKFPANSDSLLPSLVDLMPQFPMALPYSITRGEFDRYRYASFLVLGSVVCSLLAFLIFNFQIWIGLLALVLSSLLILSLPYLRWKNKVLAIENELPLFLSLFSTYLELGLDFNGALERCADEFAIIGPMMNSLLNQSKAGISIRPLLAKWALTFDSYLIKRATGVLLSAYESGSMSLAIKKIASDMMSVQSVRMREAASKVSIFTLIFVCVLAIVPTFLLIYSLLGFAKVGKLEIELSFLLVFPLVGVVLLLVSRSLIPKTILSSSTSSGFNGYLLLAPLLVLVFHFLLPSFLLVGIVVAILIPLILSHSDFFESRKIEEMERFLPDALLSISALPKGSKLESIFVSMSQSGFGVLSIESKRSLSQLQSNLKAQSVLDDFYARNPSPTIGLALKSLSQMLSLGNFDRVSLVARDILEIEQLKKERSSLLSMQKYTIVLGAVLIPLIMKTVLGLFSNTTNSVLFDGASSSVSLVASLLPSYFVIYGAISALAISSFEERRSLSPLYFAFLSLLSLLTFYLVPA
ncbi:type II secretion system F family protein [Candidatus Micrarchaeota archaeon]|nr:type II secretion system F family protein [Candidatus Micrarchaeota archaeon]